MEFSTDSRQGMGTARATFRWFDCEREVTIALSIFAFQRCVLLCSMLMDTRPLPFQKHVYMEELVPTMSSQYLKSWSSPQSIPTFIRLWFHWPRALHSSAALKMLRSNSLRQSGLNCLPFGSFALELAAYASCYSRILMACSSYVIFLVTSLESSAFGTQRTVRSTKQTWSTTKSQIDNKKSNRQWYVHGQ